MLLELCGIDDSTFQDQWDTANWPEMRKRLGAIFLTRRRDEWVRLLEGTDVCFAPVLNFAEAPYHPHNQALGMFIETAGVVHPSPAPRLSRTPLAAGSVVPNGTHTLEILQELGLSEGDVERLRSGGAIL
ncbi:CoA-transferase family III [compost metagenome]